MRYWKIPTCAQRSKRCCVFDLTALRAWLAVCRKRRRLAAVAADRGAVNSCTVPDGAATSPRLLPRTIAPGGLARGLVPEWIVKYLQCRFSPKYRHGLRRPRPRAPPVRATGRGGFADACRAGSGPARSREGIRATRHMGQRAARRDTPVETFAWRPPHCLRTELPRLAAPWSCVSKNPGQAAVVATVSTRADHWARKSRPWRGWRFRHGSQDHRPARESSNKPELGFGSWRLPARAAAAVTKTCSGFLGFLLGKSEENVGIAVERGWHGHCDCIPAARQNDRLPRPRSGRRSEAGDLQWREQ